MNDARVGALAPSSRLALYLAAVVSVYLIADPVATLGVAAAVIVLALVVLRGASRPVPPARWRAAMVFIVWVFLMRAALDVVTGVPVSDPAVWLAAAKQTVRVTVLAVGVIVLIAVTTAREIVDELEHSRLPRAARLLVMMLIQYPRVLRERYEQVVEAQVARGADRPRSIGQRVAHGAALLLPVMQSELNAIGERAALIHLRGLDVDVVASGPTPRSARDVIALIVAAAALAAAAFVRVAG